MRASRGGILANRKLLTGAGLCKVIEFDGTYRFSLSTPRWPSHVFDRMAAGGGLNVAAAGTPAKRQIDMAILGITRKCAYRCRSCYERDSLSAEDTLPVSLWAEAVRGLQHWGTSVIVLSGGEPMLRSEGVLSLLRSADHDHSEFHLHTTGQGVTDDIAAAFRRAGLSAVGIGLDDDDPGRHDEMRGRRGAFEDAIRALGSFRRAGVFLYLNTCLSSPFIRSGGLPRLAEKAAEWGVGIIRLLEPRPCGLAGERDVPMVLSDADRESAATFYEIANKNPGFPAFPLISYEAYIEHPDRLGCRMGGLSHLSISGRGDVQPCVFLPVSFGNIAEENISAILLRMRAAVPRPLRRACPAETLAPLLREKSQNHPATPVAFEAIREEWESLFSPSASPS